MQIVISIDEDVFTRLFDNGTEDYAIVNDDLFAVARSIRKGTPLPEHHGRLIDADALQTEMEKDVRKAMSFVDLKDFVWLAPTIIEGSDSE